MRIPKGFKLESEENMLRAVEAVRPAAKKQKTSVGEIFNNNRATMEMKLNAKNRKRSTMT